LQFPDCSPTKKKKTMKKTTMRIVCWSLIRSGIDQIEKTSNEIVFPSTSSKAKDCPFANVHETTIFLFESLKDEDLGFELVVFPVHHLEIVLFSFAELDHSQSQSSTSDPDKHSLKLQRLEHH